MKPSLEGAFTEVWRQALAENAKVAELGTERYTIRWTCVLLGDELRAVLRTMPSNEQLAELWKVANETTES
jgi:hypothetical protein